MELRYGLNPDQRATATLDDPSGPLRVLSGHPSYINLLDGLGAWQLVREASAALSKPVAASFKHVSPAGVAATGQLDEAMSRLWGANPDELSPVANAYVRARDCDPKCSYGDFVAVSHPVDASLASFLRGVVSDGIIAPGFEPGTVEALSAKKAGRYLVLEVDPTYAPTARQRRDVFGIRLEQELPTTRISRELVTSAVDATLPKGTVDDLVLAMVAGRHTQSNTVAYARHGMVLGIGAGQQSRVDCTRLAGAKLDLWWLRRHTKARDLPFAQDVPRQDRINWQLRYIEGDMDHRELDRFRAALTADADRLSMQERHSWLSELNGVVLASDGYIPFRDNIDHAARHGVLYIAEPGGSSRNLEVEAACREHGITHIPTGVRLFLH